MNGPHGAQDVVIDVHGLTKKFDGRAVVRNLSMQVKRGSIYGFLGPNGSGKTTTIRMLCGLLTPDEGTGTCLGYDIRTETNQIKTLVGYMTQRFSLYQDLSVRENLEFIARIYGIAKPAAAARPARAPHGRTAPAEDIARDAYFARHARREARRVDVGSRRLDAVRALVGDTRKDLTSLKRDARIVDGPGQHAGAVGAGGGELELASRLCELVAKDAEVELDRFDPRRSRLARAFHLPE